MTDPSSRDLLLAEIAAGLTTDEPIELGTMFRSPGIRVGGKIVAFLGHDGRLIVKVPRARAVPLIEEGMAEPVTMGRRTMREWVALPGALGLARGSNASAERDVEAWTPLVQEALDYVRQLPG